MTFDRVLSGSRATVAKKDWVYIVELTFWK
jgi:hypothetical protein